ncbi:GspE/PulE family protein [Lentisphaera profundi]|uniref:GspE/PulE family protein n=1 Tax=Lentisphaera profundi TaxID=1658616 RepID=A0ABY7VTY4_9BACT|nr:GspE/PulE family protein [Lentisphaera profundi]WDE97670.1 GspE/PulE family protein [Lentisphaera profundi]
MKFLSQELIVQALKKNPKFESIEKPFDEWLLVDSGEVSEQELLEAYASICESTLVDEDEINEIERSEDINQEYLEEKHILPLQLNEAIQQIAVASPYLLNNISQQWKAFYDLDVEFVLLRKSFINRKINEIYHQGNKELFYDADDEKSLQDLAKEAPIVRLVNDVFSRALELRASDIHVEPGERELNIRFRIDGVLQTFFTPPRQQYSAIASRLKLIGGLNIAEHRIPQDGRIELMIVGQSTDVRMNTLPGMYGESIVMRLLMKNIQSFSLQTVGMNEALRIKFNKLIKNPHGLILVVGPTGSGKTTTLYCALNLLNSGNEKIITIEDPIEYQINGITQVQVKASVGLTFSNGLRAIVRQDPDIILVGEIRDKETADICINAALTGHLVLSTLHTNDAAGAISRLQDMGVENFLIASSLIGVLSQRLVRRSCEVCKGDIQQVCKNCGNTGYKGRIGIYELLMMSPVLQKAVINKQDSGELNKIAREEGMQVIRDNGLEKVAQGVTTQEEIIRVCSK